MYNQIFYLNFDENSFKKHMEESKILKDCKNLYHIIKNKYDEDPTGFICEYDDFMQKFDGSFPYEFNNISEKLQKELYEEVVKNNIKIDEEYLNYEDYFDGIQDFFHDLFNMMWHKRMVYYYSEREFVSDDTDEKIYWLNIDLKKEANNEKENRIKK